MPLGKWLIISMRLPMGGIPWKFQICRPYVTAATIKSQTDFRERFTIMKRCSHNMSMECSGSNCPLESEYFMLQIEHHLRDYPIQMNEIRLLHRCDLALSLKGHESIVRAFLFDHRITPRRCDALMATYHRWEQRVRANAAEIDAMMNFIPENHWLPGEIGRVGSQTYTYIGQYGQTWHKNRGSESRRETGKKGLAYKEAPVGTTEPFKGR